MPASCSHRYKILELSFGFSPNFPIYFKWIWMFYHLDYLKDSLCLPYCFSCQFWIGIFLMIEISSIHFKVQFYGIEINVDNLPLDFYFNACILSFHIRLLYKEIILCFILRFNSLYKDIICSTHVFNISMFLKKILLIIHTIFSIHTRLPK